MLGHDLCIYVPPGPAPRLVIVTIDSPVVIHPSRRGGLEAMTAPNGTP